MSQLVTQFKDYVTGLRLPKPPFWMISIVIIGVVLSWLALAIVYMARHSINERPAFHLSQDMDKQPRFRTQGYTVLFNDNRQMRPQVPGTIAKGQLAIDDHYYRGFKLVENGDEVETVYYRGFPQKLEVDDRLMYRGRKVFNTYCYPCHGKDGYGSGPVDLRAQALMALDPMSNAWVQAQNLLNKNEDGSLVYGPLHYPEGKVYDTIVHGRGNMAGYGHQIDVEDRWAVVLYIQALQMSQIGEKAFVQELEAAANTGE